MPMAPMMSPRSDSSDNQIIFTKSDEHPLVSTFKNENIDYLYDWLNNFSI